MSRPICRVVVDSRLLDSFKARALATYPKEHAEEVWGYIRRGSAHVSGFVPADVEEADRDTVEFNFDDRVGHRRGPARLLGSIHTHPNGVTEPSEEDVGDCADEGERLMGVAAVTKRGKRKFFSFSFYSHDRQLELVVGETIRENNAESGPFRRRRS